MKIYTRTGDDGITGLFGGARVPKDDARVQAFGTVDEVNSAIGVAVALAGEGFADLKVVLNIVQNALFDIGGDLATPEDAASRQHLNLITATDVSEVETVIDHWDLELAQLRAFILPGGHPCAASLHLARAVARRAERETVALAKKEGINPFILVYLNRLSDLLFTLARTVNTRTGFAETLWAGRSRAK
jgi:cob(I)alamin adenosyltransferase